MSCAGMGRFAACGASANQGAAFALTDSPSVGPPHGVHSPKIFRRITWGITTPSSSALLVSTTHRSKQVGPSPIPVPSTSFSLSSPDQLCALFAHSFARSFFHLFDQSFVRSIARSFVHSFDQSIVRSVNRSFGQSFVRSIVRSVNRPFLIVWTTVVWATINYLSRGQQSCG